MPPNTPVLSKVPNPCSLRHYPLFLSLMQTDTPHPQQQPSPLEALDDTKRLNWRQARTLLISSTGFFTDAYVLVVFILVSSYSSS